LWRLVAERPPHLLDPRAASWDAEMLSAVDDVLNAEVPRDGPLASRTWGERNTARIQHPLSRAVPMLGRWLDMPADRLPGDNHMPRVQSPTFGASERMVVSPGHEADGFFEMPCGESGNPLSPHYADGHAAWERGERTPFLPGPPVNTLTLVPK
jgi:penicillin amidase